MKYKRIMIFGPPGAGKTTFAYKLHKKIWLPLHHLDKYFFTSCWIQRDKEDFLAIQKGLVDHEHWLIDGNSVSSLEMRWERADLVLYFNPGKLLCLSRLPLRYFQDRRHLDDRAENCPERISLDLITYLWGFDKRVRAKIVLLSNKYPDATFIEISDAHTAKDMLEAL